jgi:hypothetical protein
MPIHSSISEKTGNKREHGGNITRLSTGATKSKKRIFIDLPKHDEGLA